MKKTTISILCFFATLSITHAQTTISVTNLNWRPNGVFVNLVGDSGSIVPQPPLTDFSSNNATPVSPNDFRFRWQGLTLDTAGIGDDYVDFTVRMSSTGSVSSNVTFTGEGSGIGETNFLGSIETDEELTIEIVDLSLSPQTLGTIAFDGFTSVGLFGRANADPVADFEIQADVTGETATGSMTDTETVVVERAGQGYIFGTEIANLSAPAVKVVINNPVINEAPTPDIDPVMLFRNCSLSFSFAPTLGAPGIFDFSILESQSGTGSFEAEGYFFTSGGATNTGDGVFDLSGLQLAYDVENVTEITIKRDGVVEQTIAINNASGEITPMIPAMPGIYEYTMDATNGTDTATSQTITIAVDQPFDFTESSTRSNASQIGTAANFPLFISANGDFDANNADQGLFLTFSDQAETLTPASAGGSGILAPGNLTFDYRNSFNLFSDPLSLGGLGRLDIPVSEIVSAIETANNTALTFPFLARAQISAVNPAGTTLETIDFTIQDSGILAEIIPSTFIFDSGIMENQWISPFIEADDVQNNEVADITGNGLVTFTSGVTGAISLGVNETAFGGGYFNQDVTISLWVEIPENPVNGGIIFKSGNDFVGTTIGYELSTGELVAHMQNRPDNFSQSRAPISTGWHHVCATFDINDLSQILLYIDGTLVATSNAPAEQLTSWSGNSLSALLTAGAGFGFAGQSLPLFNGNIAGLPGTVGNLRLYGGILDEATIQDLSLEFAINIPTLEITSSGIDAAGDFFIELGADAIGSGVFVSRDLTDFTSELTGGVSINGNTITLDLDALVPAEFAGQDKLFFQVRQ